MWTTLDGYRLRLPRSGNTVITAQSPGTGRQASLRRPDGSLDPSSVRFIGRVVESSTRIGALRNTGTNRRCPVFTADVNGRHYQTITRPSRTPGELVILAVRPEVRRFSGEFSDGIGHRIAQNRVYQWLRRQGLQDSKVLDRTNPAAAAARDGIRDNRQQIVGLSGAPQPNDPDISYPGFISPGDLRRVNVEIDTDPKAQTDHINTLTTNDPHSMHVFRLVDEYTGRILRTQVWDPRLQGFRPNVPPGWRLPRPGAIQGSLPLQASPRRQRPRRTPPPPPRTSGTQLGLFGPRPAPPPPPGTPGAQLGLFDPGRVPPRQGSGPVVLPPIPTRFRSPQQPLFPVLPRRPLREFELEGFF